MLEAPPLPLLLRLATPNAMAFLVQASVSMFEIGFIGQLGTVPLAGIALMFPGLMLMQMLANGAIGGAVSSAIARALGAEDTPQAECMLWHAVVIALVAGLFFSVAWFVFGGTVLTWMGASEAVREAASGYADVVFLGATVIWLMALLNSAFRGMGNMKLPSALMVGSALVQVPLSGALVLGWFGLPSLGLSGAAIALLAVATGSLCVLLYRLQRGDAAVSLRRSAFALRGSYFRDIFRVGALAALSPVFTVLTISMINALVANMGVAVLAGFGIVSRLEFLIVPMVFGIGAAMTAMVGTNVGAGKVARAEHIGWLGGACAALITGVAGVLFAVFPGLWLDLFTDDADIAAAGARYLRIVGPVFFLQGLGLSLYFASQGAGKVFWPVVATALRFLLGVGGAYVAVRGLGYGLEAVYICIAAGMLVYGSMTAASLKLGAWRR